jgi:hypothetical protein
MARLILAPKELRAVGYVVEEKPHWGHRWRHGDQAGAWCLKATTAWRAASDEHLSRVGLTDLMAGGRLFWSGSCRVMPDIRPLLVDLERFIQYGDLPDRATPTSQHPVAGSETPPDTAE